MVDKKSAGLTLVIQLLIVGLSIAICVITAQELWFSSGGTITIYGPTGTTSTVVYGASLCLLSPLESVNICGYAWSVGAIGIMFAIGIAIASCSTSAGICGVATALVSWIWWLAAGITITVYSKNADDDTVTLASGNSIYNVEWPEKDYRTSIWAMCWAAFGLYTLQLLISAAAMKGSKKEAEPGYGHKAEGGKTPEGAYTSAVPMPPATV